MQYAIIPKYHTVVYIYIADPGWKLPTGRTKEYITICMMFRILYIFYAFDMLLLIVYACSNMFWGHYTHFLDYVPIHRIYIYIGIYKILLKIVVTDFWILYGRWIMIAVAMMFHNFNRIISMSYYILLDFDKKKMLEMFLIYMID